MSILFDKKKNFFLIKNSKKTINGYFWRMEKGTIPKKEPDIQKKTPENHEENSDNFVSNGNKSVKTNVKDGFLAKVDLEELKKELGMSSAEEIGAFLNLANPKGVYNWNKEQDNHGTRPSYNSLVRMLRKGATPKTLFGVECKDFSSATCSNQDKILYESPEFKQGVARAIEDLKKMGVIK